MKKLSFLSALVITAAIAVSCGNNSGSESAKTDSSTVIIPPPDNSSATNPSLADTNFSKNNVDTGKMKKDSTSMKHK